MSIEMNRAVLLSLRPKYAKLIYSGQKRAELRRTRPSRQVTDVFVYETSPVRKVTGWFRVLRVQTTSPSSAWKRFRRMLSITRSEFRSYLQGKKLATLYLIRSFRKFKVAVSLAKVVRTGRPPQSYRYLDKRSTRALLLAQT
jgi:predicted transcriptional regulator